MADQYEEKAREAVAKWRDTEGPPSELLVNIIAAALRKAEEVGFQRGMEASERQHALRAALAARSLLSQDTEDDSD